jgi:hypothetical protein
MTAVEPRFSQRSSGFFRQGSLVGERSLTSPRTPTDGKKSFFLKNESFIHFFLARTKRRLNTLLNKANLIAKSVPAFTEDIRISSTFFIV